MSASFEKQLRALDAPPLRDSLRNIRRGLEKEGLRVQPDGSLAQTPHPQGLGAALTHPHITTDYSEALLELITPTFVQADQCLQWLEDLHRFTHRQLGEELLWSGSMPCLLGSDQDIPVARYGSSNSGRMKSLYRMGLGKRYGRHMQTVAGIHYNFSLPVEFWDQYRESTGERASAAQLRTRKYLGLVRNFHRYCWLLLYLFGVSPLTHRSFIAGRHHRLQPLYPPGGDDLYAPFGTSLRMGELGYQSSVQRTLAVSYNSLEEYAACLRFALQKSHPAYEKFDHGADGEPLQLRSSVLQIENEFYNPIRPKRTTQPGQAPLAALREKGIEYIELRCIDLDPALPLGIAPHHLHFYDSFLLFCLLQDSPPLEEKARHRSLANLEKVVREGRQQPPLYDETGRERPLRNWAHELLEKIQSTAQLLDQALGTKAHKQAVTAQQECLDDPEQTASGRFLTQLREQRTGYIPYVLEKSRTFSSQLRAKPACRETLFQQLAQHSLEQQRQLERTDTCSFKEYLATYYRQLDLDNNAPPTSLTSRS